MNEIKSSQGLDWTQRPQIIRNRIDSIFDILSSRSKGCWGYNGSDYYTLCYVDQHNWFLDFLHRSEQQKQFVALDIGAGDFSFGNTLAAGINADSRLRNDISVTIISLRGEANPEAEYVLVGKCELLNLGAFKIEELFEEFKNRRIDIENGVDLIVSSWTFRHLVDPTGTFLQTLRLLRPETGRLFMDGFFFLFEDQKCEGDAYGNINMILLLIACKVEFVIDNCDAKKSLNNFCIKRTNSDPIHIPLEYIKFESAGEISQIYSGVVTRFQRLDNKNFRADPSLNLPGAGLDCRLYGDRKLFEELKPYSDHNVQFRQLIRSKELNESSVFQAVRAGSSELLLKCLENDFDINGCDHQSGKTPLSLAIECGNVEMFDLLLSNGAQHSKCNLDGSSPLHIAVIKDEGYFLEKLIGARGNINQKNSLSGQTVLDAAIAAKNLKAIAILLKHDVEISKENVKQLNTPEFTEVYQPEPEKPACGLDEVINMIRRGDCVVLHENGYRTKMYYQPNTENPTPNLVICDLNPAWSLLRESEWPSFLSLQGFQDRPYDYNFIENNNFSLIKEYKFGYL